MGIADAHVDCGVAAKALMRLRRLAVGTLLVLASACIQEDNTVTWFLDPNGEVTWSILERNIRSDSKNRDERMTEESQFIDHATFETVVPKAKTQGQVRLAATVGDILVQAITDDADFQFIRLL